ncbi:MAG: TolC family protein [Ferruginibacter sp.]
MFKYFATLFLILVRSFAGFSQTVSETDLIGMALKNSRNLSASNLTIKQQKQLLGASYNLPNPEVFVESPTGNFYTASITQSFEFPSVYGKQYQLQKQKIAFSEIEKTVGENDIKYQVKQLYISLQYAVALQQQLYQQDTIYKRLSTAAARQFDAGQIDYLQKLFAENSYADVHNQYLQAQLTGVNTEKQLQFIAAYPNQIIVAPLSNADINYVAEFDSSSYQRSPSVALLNQSILIAEKNIGLQKAKALPGLAFGYFNQGERSTPFQNRFRFGITLPLWFNQYKSNISAAKTEFEIEQQKAVGLQQQISMQLLQAQSEQAVFAQSLQYYQSGGLNKATEIITTAKRFYESGENDYISYLRNINDAYAIQLKYLEALKNYNQSTVSINYLKGTL